MDTVAFPPVLGFAAFSGTGKTALLVKLIPLLRAEGLRVGLIKRSHHGFDIDHPGKDSHELRQAGASPVMITSSIRRAVITEHPVPHDPVLAEELACFDTTDVDLILVEGFKRERFPKIELHRPTLGHPLLFPEDETIIAIATDAKLPEKPAGTAGFHAGLSLPSTLWARSVQIRSPRICHGKAARKGERQDAASEKPAIPVLDLNQPEEIARFILQRFLNRG